MNHAKIKSSAQITDEVADVVIYARYSSDKQTEQSIEGQLRHCYGFSAYRGFRVVGEYIDRALSGTSAETRPEFQRMIKDARKKQFRFVIVWKLDRFARNRYDSAIYKNELRKSGVKVLSATEGIGEGDESIILEAVLEAMAETYSRQLSQNVRRGMKESALKANSTGGAIPLGYKLENKRLVVDDEYAPVIRYVFEQYAAGTGKQEIAAQLNARGHRTKRGGLFTVSSFTTILQNKKYTGVYHYNGEVEISGGCPALVDEATFEKCAKKAKLTKRAPARTKAIEDYLMQGKLFCGYCGAPMVGESGRSSTGRTYHYYSCAARKKSRSCNKKNEKKGFLEWYIAEQVVEYVLRPDRIDLIAGRVVAGYENEFNADTVRAYENQLAGIEREFGEITAAIIKTSAAVILSKLNARAEELEVQKAEAEIELAKLRIASAIHLKEDEIKAWLRQFCDGDLMDEAFRRKIIDTFINAIFLYDDRLVMYFNIKDGEQVSYIEMLDDTVEDGFSGMIDSSDLKHDGSPKKNTPKTLILLGFRGVLMLCFAE